MVIVESAGISDIGKKRKNNEDALFLDDSMNLYLVADGMGGHRAGDVASNMAVEVFCDQMKRLKKSKEKLDLVTRDESLSLEANRILTSIHKANQTVNQLSSGYQSFKGMGTTLSIISFTNETIIAANVGDSPIYLIHDNEIETLSIPHTVQAQQAAIDPEAAQKLGARFKHMLTQAMGVTKNVKPDICEVQCFTGDRIVISSDGLSDKVSPDEIREVVTNESPADACKSLVDMANNRGGDDNTTIIILKILELNKNKGLKDLFSKITAYLKRSFFKKSNKKEPNNANTASKI